MSELEFVVMCPDPGIAVDHTKHYYCVRNGHPIIMLYRHISYRELSIVILLIVILATTIIIVRPEV